MKTTRTMLMASVLILALGCSDDDTGSTQLDSGGTTDDGGVAKKDSGGTKKDTGGTIPPGLKFCARSCKVVNDCCDKPPCDKGAAAMSCEKGTCIFKGCNSVVPSLSCIDNSYCGVPTSSSKPCKSDADCQGKYFTGHDKCDVKSGLCYCTSDKKCQEANKTSGGTYKCSTY